MTQNQYFRMLQYFIHKRAAIESDLIELRQSVRYRAIDPVDCLELLMATERLQSFEAFTADVLALLRVFRK
jgi:hypothetical protein